MATETRNPMIILILMGVFLIVIVGVLYPMLTGAVATYNNGTTLLSTTPIAQYKLDETTIGTNQLTNGNFDTYTTSPGSPDNWIFDDGGTSAQLTRETSMFKSGPNSVKITSALSGNSFPGLRQDVTGLSTGHTYCIQGWSRYDSTHPPSNAFLKLSDQTTSTTIFESPFDHTYALTAFAPLTKAFTATTGHTYRLLYYSGSSGVGQISYVDQISLTDMTATVMDSSGHMLNASPCGAIPHHQIRLSYGYEFPDDGNQAYVQLPTDSRFNFNSFALVSTFNLNSFSGFTNSNILDRLGSDVKSGWDFDIDLATHKLTCELIDSAGNFYTVRSNTIIQTNLVYQGICSYDNAKLRLYINGYFDNEVSVNINVVSNNNPIIIGNRGLSVPGGGAFSFNGTLSDIRLYDKSLSEAQATEIYVGHTALSAELSNKTFSNLLPTLFIMAITGMMVAVMVSQVRSRRQ